MRTAAFFCFMFISTAAIAAEWTVGPAPSDDPGMQAAMVTNDTGDTLYIWSRRADVRYQIFAELHPGASHHFGREMPRYRIDDGDEIDTARIRQDGEDLNALWGYIGPTSAIWLIWTSIQDEVLSGDRLHEWFGGSELVVSWRTPAGDTQDARFTLIGAEAAILEATGTKLGDTVE